MLDGTEGAETRASQYASLDLPRHEMLRVPRRCPAVLCDATSSSPPPLTLTLTLGDTRTQVAVGSASHVSLVDVRCATGGLRGATQRTVPAVDQSMVRSLSLHGHLLTAGSGHGRLSFLDLRTMTYLPVGAPPSRLLTLT